MTLSFLTQCHRDVSENIVVVMLELSTMFFKQNVNSIVATSSSSSLDFLLMCRYRGHIQMIIRAPGKVRFPG